MRIYGKNPVLEALKSEVTVNKLTVDKNAKDAVSNQILSLARENGVKIEFVDRFILDKKAEGKPTQGFLAEIVEFVYSDVEDMLALAKEKGEDVFILLLDGVEDPHNLGAVVRTAECMGAHGVVIPKDRAAAVNDVVLKTSAGAAHSMKIARVTNLGRTMEWLKENGVWVYGVELGGQDIVQTDLKGNIALVLGSEGKGIAKHVKEKCDHLIALPTLGKINSLNVSVACGMACYEAVRQRK